MSEVGPGDRLWPYHTHYLNEEWVIVLRGEPTLRTPEGERVLKEGDVVCFPRAARTVRIRSSTEQDLPYSCPDALLGDPRRDYRVPRHGRFSPRASRTKTSCSRGPDPRVEYWEGEE